MSVVGGIILKTAGAKLADAIITGIVAGLERGTIVNLVQQREQEGKTLDEITDELQALAKSTEAEAQDAINRSPT